MGNTKTEWKTVDTSTLEGLKQAEKLHTSGWTTYSVGLFIVKFYKKVSVRAEESRIQELEAEGMTRSDAQGVYEAEQMNGGSK